MTEPGRTWVFVYGTLMSGMSAHDKIAIFVKQIVPAWVCGRLVQLSAGYPVLLPGSGRVAGELIELQQVEAALAAMDEWEEYYGPQQVENAYERELWLVYGEAFTTMAWLYCCPAGREERVMAEGITIPQNDWRKFTKNHLQGKGDWL